MGQGAWGKGRMGQKLHSCCVLILCVHVVNSRSAFMAYPHVMHSCCVFMVCTNVVYLCCALMFCVHDLPSCCVSMFCLRIVHSCCVLMACPHVVHSCCVLNDSPSCHCIHGLPSYRALVLCAHDLPGAPWRDFISLSLSLSQLCQSI